MVTADAAARGLIARVLTHVVGGHRVIEAPDGPAALDDVRRIVDQGHTLRLLVTDVDLPGLDGVALTQAVTSLAPSVRALLMSPSPLPRSATARIVSVPHAGLSTPLSLTQLLAALAAVLTLR